MSTKQKVMQVIGTTYYGSNTAEIIGKGVNKVFDTSSELLRTMPESGLVHLYSTEMNSISDAKKHVEKLREEAHIPFLISADVEGGAVNHLKLTIEDVEEFSIPQEILEIRKRELDDFNTKHEKDLKITDPGRNPFPSQEWLGREYDQIKDSIQKKQAFLRMMTQYGESVAKICEHIGINIIFGPNLDRVENIDGKKPEEYNDRTFGSDYKTITDLSIAYIQGFNAVESVVVCPKHFVGNGISETDPHEKESRVNIDHTYGTCLLPFRDIIKQGFSYDKKIEYSNEVIQQLKEKNKIHTKRLNNSRNTKQKNKIQLTIDANNKLIKKHKNKIKKYKQLDKKLGPNRKKLEFLMMSNVANNLYADPNTPTMYSSNAISALKRPKNRSGLGFEGISITDDANMSSAKEHIKNKNYKENWETMSIYQGLMAKNDMVFLKNVAGEEDDIAEKVATLIDQKSDLDNDGQPDITEEQLNESVKKILELKVKTGLIEKMKFEGKDYYILNPKHYEPSKLKVLMGSFFSNQWPWLSKKEYYETQGKEKSIKDWPNLFYKAGKNFSLSLWRLLTDQTDPRFAEAQKNPKKLLIIDKSVRHLFIYDLETRKFEEKFEIGIGKGTEKVPGGEGPRRIIGDYQTPSGYYEVVGKRDNEWWKKNKGVSLPPEYGGEDGGMLVLAGPWHPEIALHSSDEESTGLVSNACVRINDEKMQKFLKEIPIGTMVIITN